MFQSFNPYSFGCVAESLLAVFERCHDVRFNPYSFGCVAESPIRLPSFCKSVAVSILILLDVSLKEWEFQHECNIEPLVSILILLDVSLKVDFTYF